MQSTPGKHGRAVGAVAGVLAALTLAGCAASPEEVCEHIEDVVAEEVGREAATDAIDGCTFTWQMRRDTKGLFDYKELADCVMESDDLETLAECK
jgi:hypothetical protein